MTLIPRQDLEKERVASVTLIPRQDLEKERVASAELAVQSGQSQAIGVKSKNGERN